jgi:hypothetical protein
LCDNAGVKAALAFLCAAALLSGCHKRKTASPLFAEASSDFNALYGQELDDAYVDPRMDEIEAKLKDVPKDSLDADAAQELVKRIDDGRAKVLAEQKEARANRAQAAAEPSFPPDETPPPAASEAADAGPTQPVAGMPRADFLKYFGSCFATQGPVRVADAGQAEMFALGSSADCQKQFGWYADRLVILDQDKIVGFGLKSSLQSAPVAADAGRP